MRFIRYEPQEKPQVEAVDENGRRLLRVTVTDPVLGTELGIDADSHRAGRGDHSLRDQQGNSGIIQSNA